MAFKPRGLLLSSAVSPNKIVIDAGYDVPILAKYFDWIAVMAYDYHGQWDKKTGKHYLLFINISNSNLFPFLFPIHFQSATEKCLYKFLHSINN